jgi:gluconokinase
MAVILAIDAGTTNLKVGLVDESCRLLASASQPMRVHGGADGRSEQNPQELWEAVVGLSRQMLAGWRPDCIVLSTYQFGWLAVDERMRPLGGISLLSDTRARQTFADFLREFDAAELYERTGCPALFQYPLARCFYFQKREPELWKNAELFLGSKDFLLWKLTGEIAAEQSVAAATQMKRLTKAEWDAEILERLGLSEKNLPRLISGTAQSFPLSNEAAACLGIRAGVPVLPGYYDAGAMVCGMGALGNREAGVINAGTSAMLRCAGAAPLLDKSAERRLQPYALEKNLFLNGGGVNNAGLVIDWWWGKFDAADLSGWDISRLQSESKDVFAFPYLTGERDSLIGPDTSGCLLGLRAWHTAEVVQFALWESVVFSLRMVYEALTAGGATTEVFYLAGGCSRSELFNKLVCGALGRPVRVMADGEAGLVGCGLLGLVHCRVGTVEELSQTTSKNVSWEYKPDAGVAERLAEKYHRFRKLLFEMPAVYRVSR